MKDDGITNSIDNFPKNLKSKKYQLDGLIKRKFINDEEKILQYFIIIK